MLTLIFCGTQVGTKKSLKGTFSTFLNWDLNTSLLFDFFVGIIIKTHPAEFSLNITF